MRRRRTAAPAVRRHYDTSEPARWRAVEMPAVRHPTTPLRRLKVFSQATTRTPLRRHGVGSRLSPHNQCGTNPNNLFRHTLVPPSALRGVPHPHSPPVTSPTHGPHTRRSTTDRLDTRAHTGLTPTGPLGFGPTPPECARAQEIADPALIPIVGPKPGELAQPGAYPGKVLLHPKS